MPHHYTILHTNDFHNKLTTAQAETLRRRNSELAGFGLLLDAGDAISAGNITYKPAGEPILDVMSRIGYHAMTVGNREFHFSRVGFQSKLSKAQFPILCANVNSNRGRNQPDSEAGVGSDHDLPVCAWKLFELQGGFRVLVFGITVPMITERMLVRKVSSYVFDDPISTAARLVPQLIDQQSPDLLVALTHIGARYDRLLAEQVPGIDLIIGGHTHLVFPKGEQVGDTLIVQAGSYGRMLGIVDITTQSGCRPHMVARVEEL